MSQYRIFIDGQAGTTGMQIRQRLANHPQIQVVTIDHQLRRDPEAKRRLMSEVDVTVLCLPDDAAREAAIMAESAGCRVLDASSAHRTAEGWVFGLPELAPTQAAAIAQARKVSNPGCYSTGAIVLLKPLISQGLLPAEAGYCINAISGYSGGGSKMVEQYEQGGPTYAAYGLGFNHKHIPEIQKWSGLSVRPTFIPAVGNYAQGMLVCIPVLNTAAAAGPALHQALSDYYQGQAFVQVHPYNHIDAASAPYLTPHGMDGSNRVELYVFGDTEGERALLVAKLDNLGKGASGAAVQNLNLMLGLEPGLCVELG